MQLSTMRRIDALVGRPLCFLLGSWARCVDRLSGGSHPEPPRRVLFVELSEMGSTIIAAPAIQRAHALCEQPPCFVIFKRNADSLRLLGLFKEENIFCLPDTSLMAMFFGVLRFRSWCHQRGIDTVVDLELYARISSILTVISGARTRVGFHNYRAEGLYRGNHLTHPVNYNVYQHMSANFMALLDALEKPASEEPGPRCAPRPAEQVVSTPIKLDLQKHLMEQLKQRCELPADAQLIIINPEAGTLLPIRNWARKNFALLSQRLLERDERNVVILMGVPDGQATIEWIHQEVDDPRCVNFVSCTRNLDDVLQLCHLSRVLITNDSGPAHFATLTPIPIVTLFGPETPTLYGPRGPHNANLFAGLACSPCLTAFNHRNSGCTDNICLQRISVQQVLDASCKLMDDAAQAGPA
ncbi:MAG: glycosyl transferase [Planctomycetes bacterium]|nr:glycosyl transferase [Planctomycetota bacterium]